ncbi:cell division protein FtsQ/DivIB [Pedobacter sp.]|uniref:cell division protein FtsQ/DivIB n=1 Tax=Pedobacter sp. TaxID=1411316 RepID=UPI00396CBACD
MLKNINWRAIFKGFAWLVCLAGVVVLMSFIDAKKQSTKCIDVQILIPGADNFIEREEIEAIINKEGKLLGRSLEKINIHSIERDIKDNPYIGFAKVYADMDGVIYVKIKQRQPVLRVINAGGQDYYIDKEGLKMPVSANFTANVLVANGNILEGFSGKIDTLFTNLAKDLYKTALYIKSDTLWDAQIEQIYVDDKNDFELVPRIGNQRIILGNADHIDTKLNNLMAFYKQAMPKVGWNTYKTINLKYVNQVVCERRDSVSIKKLEQAKVIGTNSADRQQTIDSVVKVSIAQEIKKATVEAHEQKIAASTEKNNGKTGTTVTKSTKEDTNKQQKANTPVKKESVKTVSSATDKKNR